MSDGLWAAFKEWSGPFAAILASGKIIYDWSLSRSRVTLDCDCFVTKDGHDLILRVLVHNNNVARPITIDRLECVSKRWLRVNDVLTVVSIKNAKSEDMLLAAQAHRKFIYKDYDDFLAANRIRFRHLGGRYKYARAPWNWRFARKHMKSIKTEFSMHLASGVQLHGNSITAKVDNVTVAMGLLYPLWGRERSRCEKSHSTRGPSLDPRPVEEKAIEARLLIARALPSYFSIESDGWLCYKPKVIEQASSHMKIRVLE